LALSSKVSEIWLILDRFPILSALIPNLNRSAFAKLTKIKVAQALRHHSRALLTGYRRPSHFQPKMIFERSLLGLTDKLLVPIRQRLWLQVLVGLFAGVVVGVLIGPTAGLVDPYTALIVGNWLALPGKLFLLAIQFVVVPLVVASVIRGIAAHDTDVSLRSLGGWTAGFFLVTTMVAVVIGLSAATLIGPGRYVEGAVLEKALAETEEGPGEAQAPNVAQLPSPEEIPDFITSLFPRDPLTSFISGNMLQIVMTAVIIGLALVMSRPDQRKPLLDLLASVQAASMVIVGWVVRFAPIAVFGLLAHITARVGLSALLGTGVYVATVLLGLLLLFLFYLTIVALRGRQVLKRFLGSIREVALLAFSTSSSAAVMPLSLSTAERKLNIKPTVARFVIPLGTTINMGGTALYQGVAAIFLAQVFQVEIGLPGMLLIVVMATGAAIGSPGTPGVGIVILATILNSVGIPPAGIAIILGVDRLIDMCRTAVNVVGDLTACVWLDHHFEEAPEAEEDHLGKVPTPAMHAPSPQADSEDSA
jgi:Na+/H+-dicarboxylate symporter